jgi:hypothetical protein
MANVEEARKGKMNIESLRALERSILAEWE